MRSNLFSTLAGILVLILILKLIQSCSNQNEKYLTFNEESFKKTFHLTGGTIYENDSLFLGNPRWIRFHPDSFLIIQELGTSKLVKIIDLKNNDIQELVPVGKGPGELISAWGIELLDKDLYVYCRPLGKIIRFEPDINRKFKIIDEIYLDGRYKPRYFYPLKRDFFVCLSGMESDQRIAIFNDKGTILKQMGDYPSFKSSNGLKGDNDIFGSYISSMPNGKKILLACSNTDIIEIYDYDEGLIKRIQGPDGIQLNVTTVKVGISTMNRRQPSVNAFCMADANSEEFWTGYVGLGSDRAKAKSYSVLNDFPKIILCFNWNGKPLRKLEFNTSLIAFDVDWGSKNLYSLEYNTTLEPVIVTYSLKDILK